MRDSDGGMLPNAHLVGMFRRIVKLLFWRIRPIFVFDGAAPQLKKLTTQRRRAQERQSATEAALTVNKLLRNKLKQRALAAAAGVAATTASATTDAVVATSTIETNEIRGDTVAALDEQSESASQIRRNDCNVVVVSSPDAVVVSDDIELSCEDDDPTYDATEAQELLAAYYQLTQANGTALADVDDGVLANLDERVQLDFLLGLRQLQRRETRHRISDLADSRASVVHDPRQFSELQVTALLGRANIARQERAVRERLSHTGGQRMVSDANTVLTFESDDDEPSVDQHAHVANTTEQRPTVTLVAGAGFFIEDDDDVVVGVNVPPQEDVNDESEEDRETQVIDFDDRSKSDEQQQHQVETMLVPKAVVMSVPNKPGVVIADDVVDVDAWSSDENEESAVVIVLSRPSSPPVSESVVVEPPTIQIPLPVNVDVIEHEPVIDLTEPAVVAEHASVPSVEDKPVSGVRVSSVVDDPVIDASVSSVVGAHVVTEEHVIVPEDEPVKSPSITAVAPTIIEPSPRQELIDESVMEQLPSSGSGWVDDELMMNREALSTHLATEAEHLRSDARRQASAAEQVTPLMVEECKELLTLFGIPYIVAPFEAEAQCAALQLADLVDGVVTDDSDSLLFGAATVYRHMFRQGHDIERYDMSDIASKCGLDRNDLIDLALLLGSDYTDGVHGIGYVRATELVAAFKPIGGMATFADWYARGADEVFDNAAKPLPVSSATRTMLRRLRLAIALPEAFPSAQVVAAYLQPAVDESIDANSNIVWNAPNFDELRAWTADRFGWTVESTNRQLQLVLERYNSARTAPRQRTLSSFFASARPVVQRVDSARLAKAIAKLRSGDAAEKDDDSASSSSSSAVTNKQKKRKRNAKKPAVKRKMSAGPKVLKKRNTR